jgi:hypothetical protein
MIFDELWRLQRKRRKVQNRPIPESDDLEALGEALFGIHRDTEIIDEKISLLQSRMIRERAEKFGVPIPWPPDKELWEEGYVAGRKTEFRLTRAGRLKILEDIRKERRARMEDRMLWVNHLGPLISPLTGFVGVVLALLSFWHSCK